MSKDKQPIDPSNSPAADPIEEISGEEREPAIEEISIDDIKSLIQTVQTLQTERNELYDRCMRSQAEFENYRKRQQKEAEQERLYATLQFVRSLLPGLDNLERAIAAAESSGDASPMIQGVELVLKEFQSVLEKFGVTPIVALGEHFDPNLHEALQQIPSPDHEPWTIIQELERGYQMHERVVRPSRVVVASPPPDA
ncbi:MAG: nucleotide exchange factor GrpE [Planctomycetota bacterium]|nr:nucleotide exchange factor GrpE [Planctomycetota bacterium]MDA1213473.1 nucleotide exchange factor GrpE [Planctomycetota bacterium]